MENVIIITKQPLCATREQQEKRSIRGKWV